MGRPFLEKFADVQWEVSEELLQAWKDGKTGYPIVDAAMRACSARGESQLWLGVDLTIRPGWMENRVRMVAACFLVKDLMLDWRESFFAWYVQSLRHLRSWRKALHGKLYRWRSGGKQWGVSRMLSPSARVADLGTDGNGLLV